MGEHLTNWDPAEHLNSPEAIEAFVAGALETGDQQYIKRVLGNVAKAKGIASISEETGIHRSVIYKAFGENGNPTLSTTLAIMKSLGLTLTARSDHDPEALNH